MNGDSAQFGMNFKASSTGKKVNFPMLGIQLLDPTRNVNTVRHGHQ
jgi:hypothetical protein